MEKVNYKWGNLPIGGGGYVTGIVAHPKDRDIKYIRTDVGGAYRWNKENEEWIPITEKFVKGEATKFGIDGIALDPNDKDVVYIYSGDHGDCDVLRSTDRGETWQKTGLNKVAYGNGRDRDIGEPIAVDPVNSDILICGTRNDGLYKYSVKANEWKYIEIVPRGDAAWGIRTVMFDRYDVKDGKTMTVYAAPQGYGLFVSHDGGETFTEVEGAPKCCRRMVQRKDGKILIACEKGIALYDGETFKNIAPNELVYSGVDVHPDDDNRIVIAATINPGMSCMNLPIYFTKDGGETWRYMNDPDTMRRHYTIRWWPGYYFASDTADIKFMPGKDNEVWFTDWYGTWVTEDIDADVVDWTTKIKGHEEIVTFTVISPPEGDARVLTGVADNAGMRYEDVHEYPPERRPLSTNGMDFCEADSNFIAAIGGIHNGKVGEAGYSTDNGKTWVHMVNWDDNEIGLRIAVSADDPDNMVALAINATPRWTDNRGRYWYASKGAPKDLITTYWGGGRNSFCSDRVKGGVFYLLTAEGFMRSDDKGAHFEMINPDIKWPGVIKAVPYSAGEVWYWGTSGIKISKDFGKTFVDYDKFSKIYSLDFGAGKAGGKTLALYVDGVIDGQWGVYRSDDMGQTFVQINNETNGLAKAGSITADRKEYGRIYMSTGGRGIYMAEPAE